MTTFKHILFPVDFSERCMAARPFVVSVAQRFNAKLTLLNVLQIPDAWYGAMDGNYPLLPDIPTMVESARGRLETFFEAPDPSIKIEKDVEQGDPGYCIASAAERLGVDLIMMPTHGYGMFRSLLLGSVTAKVLHDATCAVWTTAHTEDASLSHRIECKSILCAVDEVTPESVNLIQYANDLAHQYSAKLRLVHAVSVVETRPEKYLDTDFRQFLFQANREDIAELQQQAGTNLEVCMEGGSASSVTRAAALHHDADLVVIGRGKRHQAFGRLRSNSYAIVRDSPCPVLSL